MRGCGHSPQPRPHDPPFSMSHGGFQRRPQSYTASSGMTRVPFDSDGVTRTRTPRASLTTVLALIAQPSPVAVPQACFTAIHLTKAELEALPSTEQMKANAIRTTEAFERERNAVRSAPPPRNMSAHAHTPPPHHPLPGVQTRPRAGEGSMAQT